MSYIYHYTTLPALISIIHNQQLKLTRLDRFNELYEYNGFFPKSMPYDHELRGLFKDIFVSSWTTDKNESISLWKIFSNLESGVRIGINTTNMFSKSKSCETQVTPLAIRFFGDRFKQKTPCNTIEIVEIAGRESYEKEILDIINSEDHISSYEELIAHIQKKNTLPYISSNILSYPTEVRLVTKVCSPPVPTNKRDLRYYYSEIGADNNFEFVLVSLPPSFFEGIEIVVAPDFSETNFITLNAFLLKSDLPSAIKSSLTPLYRNFKDHNILLGM